MTTDQFQQRYLPIGDYGIIGNLQTVALVSLQGSIDFMSYKRFDSPTVFCKLLDADKGGSFSVQPLMKDMVSKQLYLPDTNVLITRFFAEEGIAEVIDYMPVNKDNADMTVVRKITTVRGNINYKMNCSPRFNYANTTHAIQQDGYCFAFIPEKGAQTPLELLSDILLKVEGQDVNADFTLTETGTAYFILQSRPGNGNRLMNPKEYVATSYQNTINFWQNWIAQSNYNGHWSEIVNRSALTLKLLISHQYGSMVAAPTFSLPETIGGDRNWDYRYTWVRDAAFSMHAFLQLGFMDEATAFLAWLKEQTADKELQLMFAIDGNTELDEQELDYLEGYRASKPVRIGNNAHKQMQLDIYGELLETLYSYMVYGGDLTYDYWKIIEQYIDDVMQIWHTSDHSIWEVRGVKREFLFSRVMCWVAMDRAIKIAEYYSFPYDILKWRSVRDEIYKDVHDNFWNEDKKAYVQSKGSSSLDSSALLMPILNVISPNSERWRQTMEAIDKELKSDVLVYRYREEGGEIDGLKGKEGTFTMCSFWYIECLARSGQTEKAKEHFAKILGYANHLGLYAEQIGMKGEHLGNFPQAFTHLALISAAIALNEKSEEHKAGLSALNKNYEIRK